MAKQKECPNCAMMVERNAKNCPICGHRFQTYPTWVVWLAILLLIAWLLGTLVG